MKKILLVLLALMLSSNVAFAAHDEWTDDDTAREAAYLMLHTIDWGQTRYIATHPKDMSEVNPILGKHPSVSSVDEYFLTTAILHAGIAYSLPAEWRKRFQYISIGFEAVGTTWNFMGGVQISF